MERVKGIEPSYEAWKASVLPLNYTRNHAPPSYQPGLPCQSFSLYAPGPMYSLLVMGGRVVDPANRLDAIADVLILDGKISAVGVGLAATAPAETPRFDASGMVVCPGLIDLHAHLREPGQSAKETIATGTAAAARGGFASVVCMPNTSPAIDNAGTVALIRERAQRESKINVFVAGAITRDIAGEELAPIGSLKAAGVIAITDDGHCVQNNELMRHALEYARMFDLPVMDHCQDYSIVTDGVMHEGYWSAVLGLRGWPAAGEELIVSRNILLAEMTGTPVHCQHLSSARSVQLLREAKRRGVPISGEVCPHHFTLTDTVLAGSDKFWETDGRDIMPNGGERPRWPSYDTNFKMNPPLRSAADRAALLEGLVDGTVEIIGSDHAPHCDYEKEVEFDYAPFGIVGFETELALSLMALYHSGKLPLSDVIAKFTVAPARLLRLREKGSLRAGADGDLTIMDANREWVFDLSASPSKSRNSPFGGWRLKGQATATIAMGQIAFQI